MVKLPRLLAFSTFFAFTSVMLASQDVPLPWRSATIKFGPPQEKNFLRISTNEDDELTELVVHWKGRDLSVPPSEFKSVPDVQLDTVKIYESPVKSYYYLNISVHFG